MVDFKMVPFVSVLRYISPELSLKGLTHPYNTVHLTLKAGKISGMGSSTCICLMHYRYVLIKGNFSDKCKSIQFLFKKLPLGTLHLLSTYAALICTKLQLQPAYPGK